MKKEKLLKNICSYHWKCATCGKEGDYYKFEWDIDVVLRCPYCRGMDIESCKSGD
jgi:DNA-directed RNA polymerase subunit RPC12/RpoP